MEHIDYKCDNHVHNNRESEARNVWKGVNPFDLPVYPVYGAHVLTDYWFTNSAEPIVGEGWNRDTTSYYTIHDDGKFIYKYKHATASDFCSDRGEKLGTSLLKYIHSCGVGTSD